MTLIVPKLFSNRLELKIKLLIKRFQICNQFKAVLFSEQGTYTQNNGSFSAISKQTNNNDLLEKDGGTKNCIYKH